MTVAEWEALGKGLQDELIKVAVEASQRWDHDAYDSYELGWGNNRPAPVRGRRKYVRMETKRVRFTALSEPFGA